MDDDPEEKDDSKRKSRNLSEKKRRDQFNLLVNELSSMVSSTSRKMDKSTILKSTITFLKHQNDIKVQSRVNEIQEEWKPTFLSNEEFTHLVLEAIDGFILVFSTNGRILYASESITSLLGHLPKDLLNMTIYDLTYDEDHSELYNLLLNPTVVTDSAHEGLTTENQINFCCHMKRRDLDFSDQILYELVQFVGYFRSELDNKTAIFPTAATLGFVGDLEPKIIFIGVSRILTPQLIREMSIISTTKSEFTSRHSLEWKFLFLDHRAPPIIGYLPFEVLGTSGYDYYHFDDLDKVAMSHEALKQKGEGTSCYYRFLTKGQQWIWLQTRYYITYHQWNSKPEFIVCTHRVINQMDVMYQLRTNGADSTKEMDKIDRKDLETVFGLNSQWSSKAVKERLPEGTSTSVRRRNKHTYHKTGVNSASMSAESSASKQSDVTQYSSARSQQKSITQLDASPQHQPSPKTPLVIGTPATAYINPLRQPQTTPQLVTTGFMEPAQYLTAIPVQSVIPPVLAPAVIQPPPPEMGYPNVVLTPTQSIIEGQLQRKHEELQQLIFQQQDELRRVSEQLLMTRYGLPVVDTQIATSISPNAINPNIHQAHHQHHHIHQPHHSHLLQIEPDKSHHHHHHHHLQHFHQQPHFQTTTPMTDNRQSIVTDNNDQLSPYIQLMSVPQQQHLQLMHQHQQDTDQQHETQTQTASTAQSVASDLEVISYDMAGPSNDANDQLNLIYNATTSALQNK